MRFESDRRCLVQTIEDLRSDHLLDTTGGAVSLRCDEELVLVTPTGAPPRRWRVAPEDLVLLHLDGEIIEAGGYAPIAAYTMHLALYREFHECTAIVHSHVAPILAYASAGSTMPSNTNATDKFGEIPTVFCHDLAIKSAFLAAPWRLDDSARAHHRPDVAAVNDAISAAVVARFKPRADTLREHALAFLMYRHGVVTMGADLVQAFDCLAKIDTNARTSLSLGPPPVPLQFDPAVVATRLDAYFVDASEVPASESASSRL